MGLVLEPGEGIGSGPQAAGTHLQLRRKRQVKEMRMRMMVR